MTIGNVGISQNVGFLGYNFESVNSRGRIQQLFPRRLIKLTANERK